jgi:hypothetical protein
MVGAFSTYRTHSQSLAVYAKRSPPIYSAGAKNALRTKIECEHSTVAAWWYRTDEVRFEASSRWHMGGTLFVCSFTACLPAQTRQVFILQ